MFAKNSMLPEIRKDKGHIWPKNLAQKLKVSNIYYSISFVLKMHIKRQPNSLLGCTTVIWHIVMALIVKILRNYLA